MRCCGAAGMPSCRDAEPLRFRAVRGRRHWPAWIRTRTLRTKISCATVTPRASAGVRATGRTERRCASKRGAILRWRPARSYSSNRGPRRNADPVQRGTGTVPAAAVPPEARASISRDPMPHAAPFAWRQSPTAPWRGKNAHGTPAVGAVQRRGGARSCRHAAPREGPDRLGRHPHAGRERLGQFECGPGRLLPRLGRVAMLAKAALHRHLNRRARFRIGSRRWSCSSERPRRVRGRST